MTDSIQVFPLGFRVTNSSGDPVNNAKIKFYDAGTSTAKTVYSDQTLSTSLGTVVRTRSDGLPVAGGAGSSTTTLIYVGTSDYKYEITDENDVVIVPVQDSVRGAISTTVSSFAAPQTTIASKTSDYTVLSSDFGTYLSCNPTSASFTITFPTAIGNNGKGFGIKHVGTANVVNWATTLAQTADGATSGKVKFQYDSIWFTSDGANWLITLEKKDTTPVGTYFARGTLPSSGYIRLNGLTMGKAASGATVTGDEYFDAYSYLWDTYSNSVCSVSTGRGASAAADWAALKTIATLDMRGRAMFGRDTMGASAASRLGSIYTTQDTPGTGGGSETQTLLQANLPSVNWSHSLSVSTTIANGTTVLRGGSTVNNVQNTAGPINDVRSGSSAETLSLNSGAVSGTISSGGSSSAHNNMPPGIVDTWIMKL